MNELEEQQMALLPLVDYERLRKLCAQAADALEAWNCVGFYDKLIAELRKAAE